MLRAGAGTLRRARTSPPLARAMSGGDESFDVVIVGGGVMGSAAAFFLSQRMDPSRICVVERDMTYSRASSPLSVGSIRQQFSVPENIRMSLYGAGFLRDVDRHLRPEGDDDPVDVQFHEEGYLFLATPETRPILEENYATQRAEGAAVAFLEAEELSRKYPWLVTDGVSAGCYGTANEGWFDPWSLLTAFRRKAASSGVQYLKGQVEGLRRGPSAVEAVQVRANDGREIDLKCGTAVLAAGAWSGAVAEQAGLWLPVVPRLRQVFVFHSPDGPQDCPMIVNTTGCYVRREGRGGNFLCGKSPAADNDPDHWDEGDFPIDHDVFEDEIWPAIAERVPAFERLKVVNQWAGLYEYNTVDQNGIVGAHPEVPNLVLTAGFSGHGIQQSPAVGRAVSELIADGSFTSLDLTRFGVERLLDGAPLRERNVV